MLKTILSIAGKPGLYKLVSQGKNMLLVESLIDGRRSPAYGNDKIVSLGDISMFTNAEDVSLRQVLKNMLEKKMAQRWHLISRRPTQLSCKLISNRCCLISIAIVCIPTISGNSSVGIISS